MLLSIIIVSYNTAELTVAALNSVFEDVQKSHLLKGKTELIVVDNNSKDSSVADIKTEFRKFAHLQINMLFTHLIENPSNDGFSAANNLGIKQATGEYIFLLNSDTIVQPGALEKLVQPFEHNPIEKEAIHRLGILSAQLLNKDGSIQSQGGSLPNLLSLACHMLMLDDLPIIGQFLPSTQHTGRRSRVLDTTDAEVIKQEWVGGTAMMIRKEVIAEIGPLDQNIFMYAEDVEFCWRAIHHQWDVGLVPEAKIIHFGSASSSSANAIKGEYKGYLYIWSKHQPLWQLFWVRLLLKTGAHLREFVFGTMVRQKDRAKVYTNILSELF